MPKAPGFQSVDGGTPPSVIDLAPARIGLLVDIDSMQHSLAAGWGGPGVWISAHIISGGAAEVLISVPPGVTEFDLKFLVSGSGRVTVTSTNDGVGTQLDWFTDGADAAADAVMIATAGPISAAAGATSSRAVTVRAALGWSWDDETLTVTSTAGFSGTIRGVLVQPVYVAK